MLYLNLNLKPISEATVQSNISASVPQLKEAIAELQDHGST
jgi:monomeric isocitrate dehydrogenase